MSEDKNICKNCDCKAHCTSRCQNCADPYNEQDNCQKCSCPDCDN